MNNNLILRSISHFLFFTSSYFFPIVFRPLIFPPYYPVASHSHCCSKPRTHLSLSLSCCFQIAPHFSLHLKLAYVRRLRFRLFPRSRTNAKIARDVGTPAWKSKVNATTVPESRRRRNSRVEYRWECANFRKEPRPPLRFLRGRIGLRARRLQPKIPGLSCKL